MSHKMLRQFIVKVSVLGYFPLEPSLVNSPSTVTGNRITLYTLYNNYYYSLK